MARNPVVYILCSENRRALHIGMTTDLGRRPDDHRRGLVPRTARYNVHRLTYFEPHDTAPDAIGSGAIRSYQGRAPVCPCSCAFERIQPRKRGSE